MKKIEAYVRHEAFEPIRAELVDRGFPSLSITEVKGSGRQRGLAEHYRGSTLTVNVLPKPANLSFVEAASMPLVLETAWRMLVSRPLPALPTPQMSLAEEPATPLTDAQIGVAGAGTSVNAAPLRRSVSVRS